MAQATQRILDPAFLDDDEQSPAKIWELLRRNDKFRSAVMRLARLDAKDKENHTKTGKYHGPAWEKSCRQIETAMEQHSFAGVALQWLVPEPLFEIHHVQYRSKSRTVVR